MSRDIPLRILIFEWVTGGGLAGSPLPPSLAVEGAAMRRAVAADFAAIADASRPVIAPLDSRLREGDVPWSSVRISADDPIGHLIRLASTVDYTVLIAPETGGLLTGLARRFEEAGLRTLGASPAAIEAASDKSCTERLLHERGIPTTTSLVFTAEALEKGGLPDNLTYPAVIKPIAGAGAVSTFYLGSSTVQLPDLSAADTYAIQPFVAGIPMSATFLLGDDGQNELVATGRQVVSRRKGAFYYRGGIVPVACPEAITLLRRAITAVDGLRGLVGVDYIWEPLRRNVTILEINPRPTTSLVGLCALLHPGRLARAWLAACGAMPCPAAQLAELGSFISARYPVRFDSRGRVRWLRRAVGGPGDGSGD